MTKMNREQWLNRRNLISQWADCVIDGCDMDTLVQLARERLIDGMDDLPEEELIEQFDLSGFDWETGETIRE